MDNYTIKYPQIIVQVIKMQAPLFLLRKNVGSSEVLLFVAIVVVQTRKSNQFLCTENNYRFKCLSIHDSSVAIGQNLTQFQELKKKNTQDTRAEEGKNIHRLGFFCQQIHRFFFIRYLQVNFYPHVCIFLESIQGC